MAMYGYHPKHRKAPWFGVTGLSQNGTQTPPSQPPKSAPVLRRQTPGRLRGHYLGAKSALQGRLGGKKRLLRRVSKVYQASKYAYAKKAREFVRALVKKGFRCPVVQAIPELRNGWRYGHHISDRISQCHHIYGRGRGGRGPLLMDERLWLGCSTLGHRWIDSNRVEARKYGWLAPDGHYNTPVPQDAIVTRNQWHGVIVKERTA